MALRIEDYAVIGDGRTAALVGFDGSIDWLCLPRFDSAACFSALLGDAEHGRWQLAPAGDCRPLGRRYRGDTLVLETEFGTDDGTVHVVDSMPIGDSHAAVVRVLQGVQGRVTMRSDLRMRFDYGRITPWLRADGRRLRAVAGPDAAVLEGDVAHQVVDDAAAAEFSVGAGEEVAFVLTWTGLVEPGHKRLDAAASVRATEKWWTEWVGRCTYAGDYREAGRPVPHHPQGADLLAIGGHRRRRNHVGPGAARRRPQLGLPLLLAPGCHVHLAGPARCRVRGGGDGLAGVATAGACR